MLAFAMVTAMGAQQTASAATPAKTDILLLFDTTGSMSGALSSAKAQIGSVTSQIDASLPDVQYAVSEVKDYDVYSSGDEPYSVVQPITGDRSAVAAAINTLTATGGGDNPEAYAGALQAADTGAGGLSWRAGARRLVVLVADDMPHDDDLNAGIPADLQIASSPFDTGVDPGPDGSVGTGDDIDWQPLLQRLANDGIPLMYVLFEGQEDYLPYWKNWAGRTGGGATDASDANLASTIVNLAEQAATGELPPCPSGQSRDGNGVCAAVTPAVTVNPCTIDGISCDPLKGTFGWGWHNAGKDFTLVWTYGGVHRYLGNVFQGAANWNATGTKVHMTQLPAGTTPSDRGIVITDVKTLNGFWGVTGFPKPNDCSSCTYHVNGIQLAQDTLDAEGDFIKTKVATHELGHALALRHPIDFGITTKSVMNQHELPYNTPQAYDVDLLKQLYP